MIRKLVSSKVVAVGVLIAAGLVAPGCVAISVQKHESPAAGKEQQTMSKAGRIRLEHVALNVQDPVRMAEWYCTNLGMKVIRKGPPPANGRFISDAGGHMMLELYHNPPDAVPDYATMNPLQLHVAFMVDDVKTTVHRLAAAGAMIVQDSSTTDSGDEIAMLRDPWGVPIQILRRANPMLSF